MEKKSASTCAKNLNYPRHALRLGAAQKNVGSMVVYLAAGSEFDVVVVDGREDQTVLDHPPQHSIVVSAHRLHVDAPLHVVRRRSQ